MSKVYNSALQARVEQFLKELGFFEDGKASGRVADLMEGLTVTRDV